MKKIIIVLLVLTSLAAVSQESALLRYNFKKGDKYVIEFDMKQDMAPIMNMDLTLNMMMESLGEDGANFETKYTFDRMAMKLIGQGEEVSFDSDMKDEELDEDAKKMKEEMAPFFDMKIYQTINKEGKVVKMKVEPEVKGADQFMSQSQFTNMEYPTEAVKVGSKWEYTQSMSSMEVKGIYTVTKIGKDKVYADFKGDLGVGIEGSMTGKVEIDRASGMIVSMSLNMNVSTAGMGIKMDMIVKSRKVN